MTRSGAVDERFQSYNIEMVEVTGGRFWKPYAKEGVPEEKSPSKQSSGAPAGLNPNLFEYRPPIDLSNPKLRKLAAALGPAYVRVSGTWANTVYFHDSDDAAPEKPPAGFNAILTRKQWKGVIDFAAAVDARLMTSFAVGTGTRDSSGAWTPGEARRWVAYTKSVGGSIAATEFMNEPNLATIGGAPKGYDAAAYARDVRVFGKFIREAAPGAVFVGPGSVAEGGALAGPAIAGRLTTEDLLKATGPVYDVFSYHLYPAVSQRCTSEGPAQARAAGTTAQAALSHEWLSRPAKIDAFYTNLRDRFEPGKPIWITETGDSACGGNPWGSTFLDTFRYLIQHGVLAQRGVQVIAHNTLAASDYGLLDEKTYDPRPNYWAAVLWSRLMGPTVLNPGVVSENGLYIYAHCMRDRRGGVTVLAINTRPVSDTVETSTAGEKYALTAKKLESTAVELNGSAMRLGPHDTLPALTETPFHAGRLSLEPTSITFLAFPQAANSACQ